MARLDRAMRGERGFTLAELLIVVAVLGFIMAGLLTLQQQGQLAYLTGSARVEVQQNARIALDLMTSELRSAQSVTSAVGCGAAPPGCTTIAFNDQNGNAVTYTLAGSNLQRTSAGVTDTIVGGVRKADGTAGLMIQTYDANGALTSSGPSVRTVIVQIWTRTELTVGPNQPRNQHAMLQGRVRLRNL